MSDVVQMPPTLPVVPRVAPVRAAEHVEPPKKSQTENHNSGERRQDQAATNSTNDDRHLRITRDDAAQTFVYRSVESDTGEVVWQWPAEEILRRAHYLREFEDKLQHEVDQKA